MSKTKLDIHALMELFLRHYIRCMTKAVKDLGYGGAPQDMRVLFLSMKDPGISISQIVDEMGRDKSQITRKVKDLENKGLLMSWGWCTARGGKILVVGRRRVVGRFLDGAFSFFF